MRDRPVSTVGLCYIGAVSIVRQLATLCTVAVLVTACAVFAPGGERFEGPETSDVVNVGDGEDAFTASRFLPLVAPTHRRRAIFQSQASPPSQSATVEVFRPPQARG